MTDNQLPTLVSNWLGASFLILLCAAGLWLVFVLLRYLHRRAYNLSPVESASGKESLPDFLRIDQSAREAQIERGKAFEEPGKGAHKYSGVVTATRLVATLMAFASFFTAVLFSFMRVEAIEETWHNFSAWERIVVIARAYPVGLSVAVILIVLAFIRLVMTVRES